VWDVTPNNIHRVTGQDMQTLPGGSAARHEGPHFAVTGARTDAHDVQPVGEDALVRRRYTPDWAALPTQGESVWDLSEPDPTHNGTMETIPGPVIEYKLGHRAVMHFRNKRGNVGRVEGFRSSHRAIGDWEGCCHDDRHRTLRGSKRHRY
jgi:hypothetical protein